jgi:hypothetical protein
MLRLRLLLMLMVLLLVRRILFSPGPTAESAVMTFNGGGGDARSS